MKVVRAFLLHLGVGVAVAGAVAGCSQQQMDAFVKNSGGVDGLTSTLKQALGKIDEPREIEMGRGIAETLLGARPLLDDPKLQRYVNEVGSWVASRSERPQLPWRFGVNDSDHVNAFAAPGGFIIVTKGMMNLTGIGLDFSIPDDQLWDVINRSRAKVKETSGIELQWEIKRIGQP